MQASTLSKTRSSHLKVFFKKVALKKFPKFRRKHLYQSFFFLRACNFNKYRLQYRCFPVNFAKSSTTHILKNTYGRLLLKNEQLQVFIYSLAKLFCVWSCARRWTISAVKSIIKILTKFRLRNYLFLKTTLHLQLCDTL